jgi:hypothetical protein
MANGIGTTILGWNRSYLVAVVAHAIHISERTACVDFVGAEEDAGEAGTIMCVAAMRDPRTIYDIGGRCQRSSPSSCV